MNKKRSLFGILLFVAFGLLVALDQITKYLAVSFLKDAPSINLIHNFFGFTYVENAGAAWGSFENMRWFLIIVTSVLIGVMLWVLFSARYHRYRMVRISSILIIAGGIGNMIDRILYGYVVDFIHFKAIDFPVFNIADCCVVIGAILMLVFFFFIYKEEKETTKKEVDDATANACDSAGGDREEG